MRDLAEAAELWNRDRAAPYPRQHGTCPVCRHSGCWGELPGAPGRWVCFSSDHPPLGVRGDGCWHGDALDLEAHARGVRRADVLRADGYLDGIARGTYRPRREPPARPRHTRAPLPPLLGAPMSPEWTAPAIRWPAGMTPAGSWWGMTWRTLAAFVGSPFDVPPGRDLDARKRALPLWSPTVRPGCSRAAGTEVLAVSALVLDLDAVRGERPKGEPDLDPDRLRAAMEALLPGLAWVAHTSASSTPECWRWRVVVPFAEPIDLADRPDDYADILTLVRLSWRRAGRTALDADPAASKPGRVWFSPARRPEAPGTYVPLVRPGAALDVPATLAPLE